MLTSGGYCSTHSWCERTFCILLECFLVVACFQLLVDSLHPTGMLSCRSMFSTRVNTADKKDRKGREGRKWSVNLHRVGMLLKF